MRRTYENSVSKGVYRRRRFTAGVAAVGVAFLLHFVVGADADTETTYYTVQPGDSLWSITSEYFPASEDPRTAIEDIRASNGLSDYEVDPGQVLKVPA